MVGRDASQRQEIFAEGCTRKCTLRSMPKCQHADTVEREAPWAAQRRWAIESGARRREKLAKMTKGFVPIHIYSYSLFSPQDLERMIPGVMCGGMTLHFTPADRIHVARCHTGVSSFCNPETSAEAGSQYAHCRKTAQLIS